MSRKYITKKDTGRHRLHAWVDGADAELNGIMYKVGAHGFAYRWSGHEWVKSEKSTAVILAASNRFQL